ncbi:hypothetical protein F4861DRAFT_361371 [Xylaria intraflava]|nr:hypothetical protein F4861DRAFT_361371 [Xylaria intraflava]
MLKRSSLSQQHVAYVEDADDDGQVLSGTEPKYARSVAPGSPRKQQPNMGKSRKESRRLGVYSPHDSDSTLPATSKGKAKLKSKDGKRSGPVVVSKHRPTARTVKAGPPSSRASDESAYYAPRQARPSRSRAHTRPESYYGQDIPRPPPRQPIPTNAYYPPPPPPPGMMPPSFPPPSPSFHSQSPSFHPQSPSSFHPQSPSSFHAQSPSSFHPAWPVQFPGQMGPPLPPPSGPSDHPFPPRDLAMRFRRPSSSMGFRQVSNPYEYDPSPERTVARRSSVTRKINKETREQENRKRMPPPPVRPKSARPGPERVVLRPQRSIINSSRKSVVFDDDDGGIDSESDVYPDVLPNVLPTMLRRGSGVEYGSIPFKNRRQSFDASESVFNYEDDDDDDDDDDEEEEEVEEEVEEDEEDEEDEFYYEAAPPPRSRSRRRSSHAGIDDKLRDASRYQDQIAGGPPPALTAAALRGVKTSRSSQSTRSTASQDESEYKHSASTHMTRSSSGEDDITIKVPAGCVVEVGNVKIHSRGDSEFSVGRPGASRSGSDHGTSIYSDERRSRSDRFSAARTRASSQAAYARGLPAPSSMNHSPLYHSQYSYDDDDSY